MDIAAGEPAPLKGMTGSRLGNNVILLSDIEMSGTRHQKD
jgi:hypothetical protein